jgi:hypothetical protein
MHHRDAFAHCAPCMAHVVHDEMSVRSIQPLRALTKTFRANKQKVIDRYSQVIYTAPSVMTLIIQERTTFFTTRYCAGKGGIVDGD